MKNTPRPVSPTNYECWKTMKKEKKKKKIDLMKSWNYGLNSKWINALVIMVAIIFMMKIVIIKIK